MTNPPPGERRDTAGIGPFLRTVREDVGMTVTQVADRMGVTHARVSHIEAGTHDPKISTVLRYCDAIGARIHIGLTDVAHTSPEGK